jgi:hypothetical protein
MPFNPFESPANATFWFLTITGIIALIYAHITTRKNRDK